MRAVSSPRPERGWRRALAFAGRWLAWLNGDEAYARHLAHWRREHPDAPPPSRVAFYRAEEERRWSGVRRCC